MFGKIFLKEWRENILIFSLAILMILGLIVLNLSSQKELTLYFSGMFLMLFLPFSALIIGSGGFYSEFKDNAWEYLFSRPIRKEKIWIYKYISLMSILLSIFLVFFLTKHFLPGLNETLKDFDVHSEFSGLFSFSLYVILPLFAFTISFSLSILYEKQFIIILTSIIIGTALGFLYLKYLVFLWMTYFYTRGFKSFVLFIALSFIIASILTLMKCDFPQTGKKILTFSKYAVIFLVVSFFLGTAYVTKGKMFSPSKEFYPYFSYKHQGDVYLSSFTHGIFKYDSKQDKLEKLSKKSRFAYYRFSARGKKIVFIKETRRKNIWHDDLWTMNTDGSEEKALIESHKKDSPFHNVHIESCILSPGEERVAFIAISRGIMIKNNLPVLWWMNTDGTGLKSQPLDFPHYINSHLIAWPMFEDSIILLLEEKTSRPKSRFKIVKINLDKGNSRVLTDDLTRTYLVCVSPKHDFLAFSFRDKNIDREALAILNLKTLEIKEAYIADLLKSFNVKWSQNGDKIAFSIENEFWVYTLAENRAEKIMYLDKGGRLSFDWLSEGDRLVLAGPGYGDMRIIGKDLNEEKRIKTPNMNKNQQPIYIWGLDNKVLVKFQRGHLWRVDLETEDWKKID